MSSEEKKFELGAYLHEVSEEYKRISWPHRSELFESTLLVLVVIGALSALVFFSDKILAYILGMLAGL